MTPGFLFPVCCASPPSDWRSSPDTWRPPGSSGHRGGRDPGNWPGERNVCCSGSDGSVYLLAAGPLSVGPVGVVECGQTVQTGAGPHTPRPEHHLGREGLAGPGTGQS